MEDFSKALVDFQRSYLFSSTQEDLARAIFWTGKTQNKMGDIAAAQESYLRVAAIDQTNFYSLRAQDLLEERAPFGLLPLSVPTEDFSAERALAEAWMRVTFNLPADTDLSGIGTLASDARIIRGNEFFTLDMIELAQLEFEDLRVSVSENAVDSFRLGNYLLELEFYRPAIFALRQVLTLAGMDEQVETLAAPRYFNLVRYGMYYQDLVFPQSLSNELDPAFLFSIIRQESLYDKEAGSGQGALGLMQITPGTAQLIVDSLGWPLGFNLDDLFRPTISIRLGTSHLSDLKISFSNELFPTLAAYNAGQSAAIIWRNLSGPDPDLFLETIRYPETHDYIKSIYEIYYMYGRIYSELP
jgi:soluble lytic murein transglycosylase